MIIEIWSDDISKQVVCDYIHKELLDISFAFLHPHSRNTTYGRIVERLGGDSPAMQEILCKSFVDYIMIF